MKAKVTRKSHARREAGRLTVYRKGDEIEVSQSELDAFGDRLEVVQQSKPGRPKKKTEPQPDPETEVSNDGEAAAE